MCLCIYIYMYIYIYIYEDTVRRLRSHPSLLFWDWGNELAAQAEEEYLRESRA